jgi:hypothetical protein
MMKPYLDECYRNLVTELIADWWSKTTIFIHLHLFWAGTLIFSIVT